MIRQGEIYLADFADAGRHPVIIVSREPLNRGNYLLAVVCTSSRYETRQNLPNCVPFAAGAFGFSKRCVAQCENMLSIELEQIDIENGPLGTLDDAALRQVVRAIGNVIDSECEPL